LCVLAARTDTAPVAADAPDQTVPLRRS